MSKRFEHDIALSFSEKDIEIAQELSKALQSYSVNLKTFQYEEKELINMVIDSRKGLLRFIWRIPGMLWYLHPGTMTPEVGPALNGI